jgi:hypothetical protein
MLVSRVSVTHPIVEAYLPVTRTSQLHHNNRTHHGLGPTALMDMSIASHPTRTHGAYGATVCAFMPVLVWKRLELHGLVRVHFLAESQQMECGVRTDLVLHTWKGRQYNNVKGQTWLMTQGNQMRNGFQERKCL